MLFLIFMSVAAPMKHQWPSVMRHLQSCEAKRASGCQRAQGFVAIAYWEIKVIMGSNHPSTTRSVILVKETSLFGTGDPKLRIRSDVACPWSEGQEGEKRGKRPTKSAV